MFGKRTMQGLYHNGYNKRTKPVTLSMNVSFNGKGRSSTRAAVHDSMTFQTEKKLLYLREVLYSETVLYAACSSN